MQTDGDGRHLWVRGGPILVAPARDEQFQALGAGEVRNLTQRMLVAEVIEQLHAARVRGDLDGMCRLLAADGRFKISGASADKPLCIVAEGLDKFRPWLSMMLKAFLLENYVLKSLIVDEPRAAAHWQASILSKVTGITVSTELIDVVEVHDGRIVAYTEFFVPC